MRREQFEMERERIEMQRQEMTMKQEEMNRNYEVPNSLKVDLMQPYLNYKAKTLLSRLRPTEIVDYECVKNGLLREFQLDAQSYLHKFNTITKQDNETYLSFAGRVKALLLHYIESRHVKTNNDQLLDLLGVIGLKQV